jgi:hypothetical protein
MHTSFTPSVGIRLIWFALALLLVSPLDLNAQGKGKGKGKSKAKSKTGALAPAEKKAKSKGDQPVIDTTPSAAGTEPAPASSDTSRKPTPPKGKGKGLSTAPGQTKPTQGPAMGKGKTKEMATPAPATGEPFVLRPVYKGQPYGGNPVSSNDTLRFEFWVNGKPCPNCALEDIQVSVADVSGQRDTLYGFKKLPVRQFSLPIKPLLKQTWLRNPNRVEITVYGVETPIRFLYADELKLPVVINILPQLR